MKFSFVIVLAAVLSATTFAQNPHLPEVLRPDQTSIAQAEQSGVYVFKLLPRGMFEAESHKDEDNPIGIRGGGAYYSFTNRVHSYNKVPQIELQKGILMVGFAGAHYGFIRDLGSGNLADISLESGVPAFLIHYKPPVLYDEIRKEQGKSHRYETETGIFTRRANASIGHVYALRAISFGQADILVAFQIHQMEKDGSLIIHWRKIKEFDVPKMLYQSEEDLRAKVDALLRDPRFREVTALVKDDRVKLSGSVADGDYAALVDAIQKTGLRSLDNGVVRRRP